MEGENPIFEYGLIYDGLPRFKFVSFVTIGTSAL